MQTALTIAGSDSGAGAGIQADLKTFAAHRVYGTCAITAVTAQNTVEVRAWMAMPADLVRQQIQAVADDLRVDAVKIGMLGTAEIVRTVSVTLAELKLPNVVVDPVMVAKGGDRLLEADAVEELRARLLPRADVVTPNIPEAEVLAGIDIRSVQDMRDAARRILQLGPRVVLVKGGHLEGSVCIDVACTPSGTFEMAGPRVETRSTHGTGCTLSAAIAANLASGHGEAEALRSARQYLEGALRNAPNLGAGHGPVNHMWRLY